MAPSIKDVNVVEFAEDHGVTDRRVRQWIQEGMPHRKRRTGTRIVRSEANRWLREQARREEKPDVAAEQARKVRAEADLKELELLERRARLVGVDEAQQRYDNFVGGLAAVAAGRLQRFERDIVRAADAPAARRITQAILAALMEGARGYADELEAELDTLLGQDDEDVEPAA